MSPWKSHMQNGDFDNFKQIFKSKVKSVASEILHTPALLR